MARVKEYRQDERIFQHVAELMVWDGLTNQEDAFRKAFRHATNAHPIDALDAVQRQEEENFVVRARKHYPAVKERLEAEARKTPPLWANADGSLPQPPIDVSEYQRIKDDAAELRDLVDAFLTARRAAGTASSAKLDKAEASVRGLLIDVLDERKPARGTPRGAADVFDERRRLPWRTRNPETALLPDIVTALVNYHEGNSRRLRELRESVRAANSVLRALQSCGSMTGKN